MSHDSIMMGYFEESKAYRLFDLVKQDIIYIRDVVVNQNTLGIMSSNSYFDSLEQ